jgi:hypothetical protein
MTEKIKTFELATLEDMTAAEMFVAGGLDPIIAAISAEVDAFIPDLSTKKGRDAVASLAHKVGKVAVRVENGKKQLTADWRKQTTEVNAEGKKLDEQLRDLQAKAKAPLILWQVEEDNRIAAERLAAEQELTRLKLEAEVKQAEVEAHHEDALRTQAKDQERVALEQAEAQKRLDDQQAEIDAAKQKLIDDETERVRLADAETARIESERLAGIAEKEQEERDLAAEIKREKDEEERIEQVRLDTIAEHDRRVAAKIEEDRLAQVKRDENKRIRTRVQNKIKDKIGTILQKHPNMNAEEVIAYSEEILTAIADDEIPNVHLVY